MGRGNGEVVRKVNGGRGRGSDGGITGPRQLKLDKSNSGLVSWNTYKPMIVS